MNSERNMDSERNMNSSISLPTHEENVATTTTEDEVTTTTEDEAPKFKKPAVPLERKIKKKKKKKVTCSCNARFKTIQGILEALGYKVLGLMKDEPEKAGPVLHLLDDFARKLDVIEASPINKDEQVCLAKRHLFDFWDALSRLDVIYGAV